MNNLDFGIGIGIGIIIGLLISLMLDKWHQLKEDMKKNEAI